LALQRNMNRCAQIASSSTACRAAVAGAYKPNCVFGAIVTFDTLRWSALVLRTGSGKTDDLGR
jgi:hypothetical protein